MKESLRPRRSAIRLADILLIGQVGFLGTLSWTVPEQYWFPVVRRIARALLRVKLHGSRFHRNWLMFHGYLKPTLLDGLVAANLAHRCMARMQGYRAYRPGGWRPEIEVVGAEHIEAGLSRGRGVVLWIASGFTYSDLVTKKGLYEVGYGLNQLSRPTHGLSPTRFGTRVLNPVWTRVEDRYLEERVTIRDGDSRSALDVLRSRLRENRIVSVAVSDQARRTVEVGVLGARVRLATGPVHLARTMGAVLLPVFSVKTDVGFTVNVEASLVNDEDREEPYQEIVQRYARTLEPHLLKYPEQWSQSRVSIFHEPLVPALAPEAAGASGR